VARGKESKGSGGTKSGRNRTQGTNLHFCGKGNPRSGRGDVERAFRENRELRGKGLEEKGRKSFGKKGWN